MLLIFYPVPLDLLVDTGCVVENLRSDGKLAAENNVSYRSQISWSVPRGRNVSIDATINGIDFKTNAFIPEGDVYPKVHCSPPSLQINDETPIPFTKK
jgi:hypothetical protein